MALAKTLAAFAKAGSGSSLVASRSRSSQVDGAELYLGLCGITR
jgi:hypothetical protein